MAQQENSPTVRHRRLARELRQAREAAGITMEQASAALGWSRPKLVRFETAKTRPQARDVAEMFGLYGGDEALKLALMQLARDIRTRGWWSAYGDVLVPSFIELENDASTIRSWQVQLIHGLLQTPDYARAVMRADVVGDAEINRRLQAREHRKAVLARDDAPALEVLLDEAVLRRPVGGSEVLRGQLRALLEAGERTHVSVRVVPTSLGAYPALGNGSVTIFGFPRAIDPDVAYVEGFAGGIFIEDTTEVRRCSFELDRLSEAALSEEDSAGLIRDIIKE